MYHARVLLHLPPAALARACSLSPAQGAAFPIREQQRGPLLEAPHLIPQAKPSKTPGLKKSILWSTRLPFQSRTQRMPCTNRSSQNGDISSLVPKQDGGGSLTGVPPGGVAPWAAQGTQPPAPPRRIGTLGSREGAQGPAPDDGSGQLPRRQLRTGEPGPGAGRGGGGGTGSQPWVRDLGRVKLRPRRPLPVVQAAARRSTEPVPVPEGPRSSPPVLPAPLPPLL